jgi:hypothetical protein
MGGDATARDAALRITELQARVHGLLRTHPGGALAGTGMTMTWRPTTGRMTWRGGVGLGWRSAVAVRQRFPGFDPRSYLCRRLNCEVGVRRPFCEKSLPSNPAPCATGARSFVVWVGRELRICTAFECSYPAHIRNHLLP